MTVRPLSYGGGYVPGYPPLWQYPQGVPYDTPSDSNRHSHYHLPVRHSAWYYPQTTPTLEAGRRQEGWRLSPSMPPSSASQLQMWRSCYFPPSPGVISAYQAMAHLQGYNYSQHENMMPRPAPVYVVHNYHIHSKTTHIHTDHSPTPRPPDGATQPPGGATHPRDDAMHRTGSSSSLDNDAGSSDNSPHVRRSSTFRTDSSKQCSTIHIHGSYHGGYTLQHVNSVNIGNDNHLGTTTD
ncbi:hypothetical protein NP493_1346g00014 [Ridgeia piscesae]|uniref:Uncharacterized protein n=1 Tax=Ridgeia piscesae TaxID=27915 RepID=A0AAD9K6R7_RIDPI|nr:hypothetical protein NP493_1346g00014 [Ridgeia piscesae]